MKTQEAITIIEGISKSLRGDPTQFHYTVGVVGLKATATAPGSTGLHVQVTGGGTGHTTGLHVQTTVDGGQMEVVQRALDEGIRADVDRALQILEDLVGEIAGGGDKGRIRQILDGLKGTVLTPALQAAIFAVVTTTLGKV